jgi:LmbE family N-acetylglucosaminyl deacetylase
VQRRYRSIARHYSDLADREEQADKRRMVEHLEQIRRERQERPVRIPGRSLVPPSHHANDNLTIGFLRLMQVYERVRRIRAVQKSRDEIFVKGPQ